MGRHNDDVGVGDVFKDTTPRARGPLGIGTEARAPVRLDALQCVVHQIASEDRAPILASNVDANMAR